MVGELERLKEKVLALADLQTSVDEVSERLTEKVLALDAIIAMSESSTRLRNANNEEMISLKADLEAERTAHKEQVQLLEAANTDIVRLSNVNTDLNDKLELLQSNLSDITRISEEQATTLHDTAQTLQIAVEEKNVLTCQFSKLQAMYNSAQEAEKVHTEEVAQLNAMILRNDTQVTAMNDMIAVMESNIAALEDEVATTKSEREEVVNKMESTTQQLSLARDEVSTHSAIVSKLESSINALQNERDNALKQHHTAIETLLSDIARLKSEKDELASAIEALTVKLNVKEANCITLILHKIKSRLRYIGMEEGEANTYLAENHPDVRVLMVREIEKDGTSCYIMFACAASAGEATRKYDHIKYVRSDKAVLKWLGYTQ
jgi:chromosome segregation ATPase